MSLIRVVGGKTPIAQARLGTLSDQTGGGRACWYFSSGVGCKYGKRCTNEHDVESLPSKGKGKWRWDTDSPPHAAAAAADGDEDKADGQELIKIEKKKAAAAAKAEAKAEAEAAAMRATLQRLPDGPDIAGKAGRVVVTAHRAVEVYGSSTLDSGASAMFRHLIPNEDPSQLTEVNVELALGSLRKAKQDFRGDVVHAGPQLASMGMAVEDANLSVFWSKATGISMAQISSDAQLRVANMMSQGESYIQPQVVDKIPMLSAQQTEKVRSQIAGSAVPGGAAAVNLRHRLFGQSDLQTTKGAGRGGAAVADLMHRPVAQSNLQAEDPVADGRVLVVAAAAKAYDLAVALVKGSNGGMHRPLSDRELVLAAAFKVRQDACESSTQKRANSGLPSKSAANPAVGIAKSATVIAKVGKVTSVKAEEQSESDSPMPPWRNSRRPMKQEVAEAAEPEHQKEEPDASNRMSRSPRRPSRLRATDEAWAARPTSSKPCGFDCYYHGKWCHGRCNKREGHHRRAKTEWAAWHLCTWCRGDGQQQRVASKAETDQTS